MVASNCPITQAAKPPRRQTQPGGPQMHDLDDIGAIAAYIACDSVTRAQRFASS
jgi:hypothetical protein